MRYALALSLLVLLFALPGWAANEARCDELGSSYATGIAGVKCNCNEPLLATNNPTSTEWDPNDTTASDLECNGDGAHSLGDNWANYTQVSGSSAGLPAASNVMRVVAQVKAASLIANNVTQDFTNGTWCDRFYVRWDQATWTQALINRIGEGNNNDVKGNRYMGGGNPSQPDAPNMQCLWHGTSVPGSYGCAPEGCIGNFWGGPSSSPTGNPECTFAFRRAGRLVSNNGPSGQPFNIKDCWDDWCRVETCMDHNSQADNKINFRWRAERLSDKQTWSWPDFDSLLGSTPAVLATNASVSNPVKIISNSTPDWSGTPNPTGAIRWWSHTMVAQKQVADETFWIGPATELEGGAPGPTWNMGNISVTPSVCTKGTDCDAPVIAATVSGTAIGTPTCQIDCDLGAGPVSATCSGCNGSCSISETQCDYTSATAGIYNPILLSTREDVPTQVQGTIDVRDPTPGNLLYGVQFEGTNNVFTDGGHCTGDPCATSNPVAWTTGTAAPPQGSKYATNLCNSGLSGNLIFDGVLSGGSSWGTEAWFTFRLNADAIGTVGSHIFFISDGSSVHPCGETGLVWSSTGNMAFDVCGSEGISPMTPRAVADNAWGEHKIYINTATGVGGWWSPTDTKSNAAGTIVQGSFNATAMRSIRMFRQTSANCADVNFDDWNVYSADPDGAPTPTVAPANPSAPRLIGSSPGGNRN